MASIETLRFVLFGDDRASSAFSRFARNVDDTTKAVDKNNLSLGDSKLKLDLISAKAEELGKLNPDVKVQIDDAAAKLKLAVLKHELRDIGSGPNVGGSGGLIGGLLGSAGSAGGAGASGLSGIAATLPVIGTIGPEALGALAIAGAAAALALAPVVAALIPITAGFGLLAAAVVPDVTKVFTALTAKGKDLNTALAALSPAERDLVRYATPLKLEFQDLMKAVQPEIMTAFGDAIDIIAKIMPALKPLVMAAGKALDTFLGQLSDWLSSPQGQSFINWLKTVGPKDIKNFGRVLWDVAKGVGAALHVIYSAGSWIDKFLTHWHDDWILVKTTAQIQWDEIKIAAFKAVDFILGVFSHIPFIGHQFAEARVAIRGELMKIQDDVRRATGELQSALDRIHGEKVSIQFTSAFVASHGVPVAPGGMAKGTPSAAPGWAWVGEKGAELVKFSGGETVLPNHVSRQVARGYAAGAGWDINDVFDPRVALAIKRINAGVDRFENAGIGYVKDHPFKYWTFGSPGGAGGSGVARWRGTALQVLGTLGLPYADVGTVLSQMATESGGNPTIVNKWDSNWLAGHPSVGLMQVIAGTFAAYAGRYRGVGPFEYGVSVNPFANIYAGINYAIHRYGNPGWLSVLGHGHGYDQGGWLPPGLSLAYNGTGRPEAVGGAGGTTINIANLNVTAQDPASLVRGLQKYAESNGGIRLRIRTS